MLTTLPLFCSMEQRGFYRVWTLEPLAPANENADESDCTQRVMQAIENVVRGRPGSWLWMYRRWKLVPPGADETRFPPYSRALRECEGAPGDRKKEDE